MSCNCSGNSDPTLPLYVPHTVECPEFWNEVKSLVEGLVRATEDLERELGHLPRELVLPYIAGKMALREPIVQKE